MIFFLKKCWFYFIFLLWSLLFCLVKIRLSNSPLHSHWPDRSLNSKSLYQCFTLWILHLTHISMLYYQLKSLSLAYPTQNQWLVEVVWSVIYLFCNYLLCIFYIIFFSCFVKVVTLLPSDLSMFEIISTWLGNPGLTYRVDNDSSHLTSYPIGDVKEN